MRLGRWLFGAGVAGLAAALLVTVTRHRTPTQAPAVVQHTSSTGGVGWLALPAAVVVVVCAVGAVRAFRRERPTPRAAARRLHEHWHVILNAQPAVGGPWAVAGRGYRQQPATSRAEVAAAVEAEAAAIGPHLRYRAEVVEAQPTAVR